VTNKSSANPLTENLKTMVSDGRQKEIQSFSKEPGQRMNGRQYISAGVSVKSFIVLGESAHQGYLSK
jgi:hypothetical protein